MKISTILVSAALLLTATSCDLIQTVTTKRPTVTAAEVVKTPTAEQVVFIPGEWSIFTVDNRQLSGDERPYITFDTATSRFYGTNGCNTINGDYTVSGNHLTLSNIISTQRYCPDAEYELQINNALNNVTSFTITNIGNESYMSLLNNSGKTLMVIRKHNMDYINGLWQIYDINGKVIDQTAHPDLQVTFDVPELRIHGNTGCNVFNGNMIIDPDKTDAMQFVNMATTLRACPNQALETELLLALESVDRARPYGADTLELMDQNGKPIITLHRIKR